MSFARNVGRGARKAMVDAEKRISRIAGNDPHHMSRADLRLLRREGAALVASLDRLDALLEAASNVGGA